MKKLLPLASLSALLAHAAIAEAPIPTLKVVEKLKQGEQVTIVAFGDSNTEITFHTHGKLNWVGLLSAGIFQKYGHGVCQMINSGRCGSSYQQGLTRLERDVLRFNPDLVILAFGMNDALGGLKGLPKFEENVRETIRQIRERCGSEILIRTSNPVVIVNGLPRPEGSAIGRPWEAENRPLKEYMEKLVELAKELDCPVVDHYSLWCNETFPPTPSTVNPNWLWMRMSDGIHPGAVGHAVFYREMVPYFDIPTRLSWEQ